MAQFIRLSSRIPGLNYASSRFMGILSSRYYARTYKGQVERKKAQNRLFLCSHLKLPNPPHESHSFIHNNNNSTQA